jgi:ABC-2 type transport system permease protein
LPSAQQFREAIAADKRRLFGHDESHPAFVAFKARVLAEYGVARVEDLPVSFRGLSLREDDHAGYRIFDRHHAALQATIDRQDALRALPGFLLPALAVQPVSMALAGTDSRHQHHFTTEAESHRRLIQEIVSDDLIRNARNGGPDYQASPALFARIPSFAYQHPSVGEVLVGEARNLVALALWAFGCALFALRSVARLRAV